MIDKFEMLWTKIDEMDIECSRNDRSGHEVLEELMNYIGELLDAEFKCFVEKYKQDLDDMYYGSKPNEELKEELRKTKESLNNTIKYLESKL